MICSSAWNCATLLEDRRRARLAEQKKWEIKTVKTLGSQRSGRFHWDTEELMNENNRRGWGEGCLLQCSRGATQAWRLSQKNKTKNKKIKKNSGNVTESQRIRAELWLDVQIAQRASCAFIGQQITENSTKEIQKKTDRRGLTYMQASITWNPSTK